MALGSLLRCAHVISQRLAALWEAHAEPWGPSSTNVQAMHGLPPQPRQKSCSYSSLGCRIMRAYMAKTGTLGHDMMFRSCTIQTNIDFEDEADMVEKMRIGVALQPIATALFANSPFRGGKPSGQARSGQGACRRKVGFASPSFCGHGGIWVLWYRLGPCPQVL